jgi:hypothetical protein
MNLLFSEVFPFMKIEDSRKDKEILFLTPEIPLINKEIKKEIKKSRNNKSEEIDITFTK